MRNPATAYLDWLETQEPAEHNCTPSVTLNGRCSRTGCARRWKPTVQRSGPAFGRIVGWEPVVEAGDV